MMKTLIRYLILWTLSCLVVVAVAEQPRTLSHSAVSDHLAACYYTGDGLGYNIVLEIEERGTFRCRSFVCLGLYGEAKGSWILREDVIVFRIRWAKADLEGYLSSAEVGEKFGQPLLRLRRPDGTLETLFADEGMAGYTDRSGEFLGEHVDLTRHGSRSEIATQRLQEKKWVFQPAHLEAARLNSLLSGCNPTAVRAIEDGIYTPNRTIYMSELLSAEPSNGRNERP